MSPEELQRHLLILFRQEHAEHVGALRRILAVAEAENRPFTDPEWEEVLRRFHTLKGAARAAGLPALETNAHEAEDRLGRIRGEGGPLSEIAAALRRHLDAGEDALDAFSAGEAPRAPAPPLPAPSAGESAPPSGDAAPTVRVAATVLDDLLARSGQLRMEEERQREVTAALTALERRVRTLALAPDEATALRREVASLRRMQRQAAWRLRQLAGRVQESVREARFVPAETITVGFGAMLRDLARDTGREVDFRVVGGETTADRQVLQALRDPLLHLLRNTISHGIEPADERAAAGKPRAGRVVLRFDLEGARLRVTVDDDGRGIDRERIVRTAVERGLLSGEDAAQAGIEQVIFATGFSTSATADRLSGRGMGLPVVAQAVARLQGEVSVAPKTGPGARIVLTAPLSLSLHRLLLAAVGERQFGIPVTAVEGLHRVRAADVSTSEGVPYIRLRGDAPLRLVHPASLLDLPAASAETLYVALLRHGGRRLALAADGFVAETTTAVQEMGPYLRGVRLVVGSFLLRGGAVGLVLNVAEVFERAWSAPLPLPVAPEAAARDPWKILVVDDSITTRTLERSILESQGYRVQVAVDGAEALSLLRRGVESGQPVADLIVADVEMPRMNGFELLAAVKQDARLASLPYILVTSREASEDRERGVSLGADAYIVKRQFDQRRLLETIEQLLY